MNYKLKETGVSFDEYTETRDFLELLHDIIMNL